MQAKLNGAEIFYTDVGDKSATPIVLIHGFPFNSDMWRPQIDILKSTFRVITYDVRGHGRSEVGDGQYTLEMFVDDLIALLDYLLLEKVVLCGLSMGGYIALRTVERNPERCRALILCDTTSNADSDEAKLRRAASIKATKKNGVKLYAEEFPKALLSTQTFLKRSDLVDTVRSMIQTNSAIGICGALLAMAARTETTLSLPEISVPTLILVGQEDKTTPPELSEKMHQLVPNSEVRIVSNAAHLSNLENPEEFNTHLLDFLTRHVKAP